MNRDEELELQFSPSRWSRRYRAEEIIQKHVEFITKASNSARKTLACQLNVPYGPTEHEKLDLFGTHLPDDAPILVYIHGAGYWQELSREISRYVAAPLVKNNFKVIIVGYTLCPTATLAQIEDQIQRAFLKCVEYAQNNDSRSLYLCGHSAGAHLVASLFHSFFPSLPEDSQNILKGVLLISGIYDLVPLTKTYINDTLKLDMPTARRLSPLYQPFNATKEIVFLVIYGDTDSPAYKEQSESLQSKLTSLGYVSELIVVKEVDHYDIVENMWDENYEIVRLLLQLEDY